MSIGIMGLERNCAQSVAHRFGVPAQRDKRKANIMVEHRVRLIQSDRLPDHIDGDVGAADFDGDNAKMMEAVGMLWIGGQGLMVQIHRLGQLSCLEASKSFSEQTRDRPIARA